MFPRVYAKTNSFCNFILLLNNLWRKLYVLYWVAWVLDSGGRGCMQTPSLSSHSIIESLGRLLHLWRPQQPHHTIWQVHHRNKLYCHRIINFACQLSIACTETRWWLMSCVKQFLRTRARHPNKGLGTHTNAHYFSSDRVSLVCNSLSPIRFHLNLLHLMLTYGTWGPPCVSNIRSSTASLVRERYPSINSIYFC